MLGGFIHSARLPGHAHTALIGPIVGAVLSGVLARALLLRSDHGPFPTHPHGRLNYLFLGFVGAILGALAPPALLTANYTAGVFLGLGLTQFHTVREIERTMLLDLDRALTIPRGHALIEGTAISLETRNYLVISVAIISSAVAVILGWGVGLAIGLLLGLAVGSLARRSTTVGQHARVLAVPCRLAGGQIRVGREPDAVDMRLPPSVSPEDIAAAVGIRIVPLDYATYLTLVEHGQRQAILHMLAATLGVRLTRRTATPSGTDDPIWHGDYTGDENIALLPRTMVDTARGALFIVFFAHNADPAVAVRVVASTPLLEAISH